MSEDDPWLAEAERLTSQFASTHGFAYRASKREISASFEIGCFHILLRFYAERGDLSPVNLQGNQYRYLTTPAGNPSNFSYVQVVTKSGVFEIRQQVRIANSKDSRIAFTPDLVVLPSGVQIKAEKHDAYANGRRRFFSASSDQVVAVHECKSLPPFPELLVSFLGMIRVGCDWAQRSLSQRDPAGDHLAPTLFVGGNASSWNARMIRALEKEFPVNIVCGLHVQQLKLVGKRENLNRFGPAMLPSNHSAPTVVDSALGAS